MKILDLPSKPRSVCKVTRRRARSGYICITTQRLSLFKLALSMVILKN